MRSFAAKIFGLFQKRRAILIAQNSRSFVHRDGCVPIAVFESIAKVLGDSIACQSSEFDVARLGLVVETENLMICAGLWDTTIGEGVGHRILGKSRQEGLDLFTIFIRQVVVDFHIRYPLKNVSHQIATVLLM
jgi:hypothetical protein